MSRKMNDIFQVPTASIPRTLHFHLDAFSCEAETIPTVNERQTCNAPKHEYSKLSGAFEMRPMRHNSLT